MASRTIPEQRIKFLNRNQTNKRGDYVLYWMQQSQRAHCNHALEYAIQQANQRKQKLRVVFGLTRNYPEANARHYRFMLQGLADAQSELRRRDIPLDVYPGHPDEIVLQAAERASLLVCDRGYLRHQKLWRQRVAEQANCPVVQIEADAIVPVETASDKAEFAARTLRPKLEKHKANFLVDLNTTGLERDSLDLAGDGLDLSDPDAVLADCKLDNSVAPVDLFEGGGSQARHILRRFIDTQLDQYEQHRNQPQTDTVSHMAMYLHFGQISPLYIALQIAARDAGKNAATYLEELLVRRELAMNYVHFAVHYDSYKGLPHWARTTLAEHRNDRRDPHYTRRELENAATHDEYWNAAMREMKYTGFMHNYMRMYWGKKVLEWSNTPEYAYQTLLTLNNKYFLDGRDANSFVGVAWCFGLHDRPWQERPIFGKVRYMNAAGLERKCDPKAYVRKVDRLVEAANKSAPPSR